ncbi:MAG: hypothetical protein HY043_14030 [Verrucomicrobia bacterium]|nr:hypothetical protein [Verrucomicrobiota bacterium]
MKLAVFAYNFPHRKTQEFLLRLFLEKAQVVVVLAADPVKLNIPSSTLRVKPRHGALIHPRVISERLGWRYEVVDHKSQQCADLIKELAVDVGVIAGARILKEPVVSAPRIGVVNFHPGLIPEVRGMDALQWAIYENKPMGVTAHVIDERIDAGRIILRQAIATYPDDELIDLSLRLSDTELEMLPAVLTALAKQRLVEFPLVASSPLHRKMPPELERELPRLLAERLNQNELATLTFAP